MAEGQEYHDNIDVLPKKERIARHLLGCTVGHTSVRGNVDLRGP